MTGTSTVPGPASSALTEVSGVARAFEPERYLAATLAEAPARLASIAIAAYAADLQRIVRTSTQPLLGEIRLQWWRDTLDAMNTGRSTASPLADALSDAIARFDLPTSVFVAMSEARAFDLYDDAMPDQPALDGYLAKTEAIPFELTLRVAGMPPSDALPIALAAGRVFGLTRLLARLPDFLANGRPPLPSFDPSHPTTSLEAAVADIRSSFASLGPQLRRLPRRQRSALLPLAVVPSYLRAIERHGRDPLRQVADLAPFTRAWRIGLAHVRGLI